MIVRRFIESIALCLALAGCTEVAGPVGCPDGERRWWYHALDDAGVTVADLSGCATPERMAFLRDSLIDWRWESRR